MNPCSWFIFIKWATRQNQFFKNSFYWLFMRQSARQPAIRLQVLCKQLVRTGKKNKQSITQQMIASIWMRTLWRLKYGISSKWSIWLICCSNHEVSWAQWFHWAFLSTLKMSGMNWTRECCCEHVQKNAWNTHWKKLFETHSRVMEISQRNYGTASFCVACCLNSVLLNVLKRQQN